MLTLSSIGDNAVLAVLDLISLETKLDPRSAKLKALASTQTLRGPMYQLIDLGPPLRIVY